LGFWRWVLKTSNKGTLATLATVARACCVSVKANEITEEQFVGVAKDCLDMFIIHQWLRPLSKDEMDIMRFQVTLGSYCDQTTSIATGLGYENWVDVPNGFQIVFTQALINLIQQTLTKTMLMEFPDLDEGASVRYIYRDGGCWLAVASKKSDELGAWPEEKNSPLIAYSTDRTQ
jgi:hypothetical protein